jgi:hypothetical protein
MGSTCGALENGFVPFVPAFSHFPRIFPHREERTGVRPVCPRVSQQFGILGFPGEDRPAVRHSRIRTERRERRGFQRNFCKLRGPIRHSADRDGSERRDDGLRHRDYSQRNVDQQRAIPSHPINTPLRSKPCDEHYGLTRQPVPSEMIVPCKTELSRFTTPNSTKLRLKLGVAVLHFSKVYIHSSDETWGQTGRTPIFGRH